MERNIKLKYVYDHNKKRLYDESTPIFDEHGKQIGMLNTLEIYDD